MKLSPKRKEAFKEVATRYGLDPRKLLRAVESSTLASKSILKKRNSTENCIASILYSTRHLQDKNLFYRAIQEVELSELSELCTFYYRMSRPESQVHSLDELAKLILDVRNYLQDPADLSGIIGHPSTLFARHSNLDRLTRNYYTRLPASIDVSCTLITDTDGDNPPIRDSRLPTTIKYSADQTESFFDIAKEKFTCDCNLKYEWHNNDHLNSPFVRGMHRSMATRLERMRGDFKRLKLLVMAIVEENLRVRDSSRLWEESFLIIARVLNADDAQFLLDADQFYDNKGIFSESHELRPFWNLVSGGLEDIISLVGYCEEELRFGYRAEIREILSPLLVDHPCGALRLDPNLIIESILGEDRTILSKALKASRKYPSKQFWDEFKMRALADLENRLFERPVVHFTSPSTTSQGAVRVDANQTMTKAKEDCDVFIFGIDGASVTKNGITYLLKTPAQVAVIKMLRNEFPNALSWQSILHTIVESEHLLSPNTYNTLSKVFTKNQDSFDALVETVSRGVFKLQAKPGTIISKTWNDIEE